MSATTGQRPDRRSTLITVAGAFLAVFAFFAPLALFADPFFALLALLVVWPSIALVAYQPLAERIVAKFELGWRHNMTAADVRRPAWVVVAVAGGAVLLRDWLRGDFTSGRLAGFAFIAGAVATVVWALRGRSR